MAETFDLDDFDNPPPPPRYLYKYLSAERVGNVLARIIHDAPVSGRVLAAEGDLGFTRQ